MTTRQVTVGVDGTLIAVRALDRAAEEAVLRGALLDIVYAVPDLDEAGPVLASAAARVRQRHPGLPVTASAFEGGPVQALAQHGRDAELTVVGTRGLGGIAGLLLGSVSLRLAARMSGPLLVVRGNHRSARRGEVLLGLEGDADADAAAYAFAEAARRGVRLSVLDAAASRRPAPAPPVLIPADRARDDAGVRVPTEQAVPRRAVAGLRRRYPQGALAAGGDPRSRRRSRRCPRPPPPHRPATGPGHRRPAAPLPLPGRDRVNGPSRENGACADGPFGPGPGPAAPPDVSLPPGD
ncbi:universal stress protein [Streptomyces mirabilis]